jgi:Cu+-exporting ATPase
MHCSSCIWLLENLFKLDNAIIGSRVNFLNKTLFITFRKNSISFRKIVELLASIGYEPDINFSSLEKDKRKEYNKGYYYKIGISGFAFGNIMLLSFPEYLALDASSKELGRIFSYLNIILSIPVLFYCASEFFISSFKGLRKKIINIDVPLALGIFVLFAQSIYEIFFNNRAGYLDSMSGLVFLMLIGRLFQSKTYDAMNFERSYKSYLPISITINKAGKEKIIPLDNLKVGNRIVIRNNEIIPADAILYKGEALIDYSFVTGESDPIKISAGEIVYAGGKQTGSVIELEIVKDVSQSYLTQLWNSDSFTKKNESSIDNLVNFVSKYFTFSILLIASVSSLLWLSSGIERAIFIFTSILIVACPCALALSSPFTLGNTMRIFGKNKLFLKNSHIVEKISKINTIVFDKTGTITNNFKSVVEFRGSELSDYDKTLIKALTKNSTHPLSERICNSLNVENTVTVINFKEIIGEGIEALIDGNVIHMGNKDFIMKYIANPIDINSTDNEALKTLVYLSINEKFLGYFIIYNSYRENLEEVISQLKKNYEIHLITGDNEGEKKNLIRYFTNEERLHFNCTPLDKLNFIKNLQQQQKKVLMLGDGLNDAGALKQSDVGISITENSMYFTPACDGILESFSFKELPKFLNFSHTSLRIIKISFVLSFIYNIIGISVAVQGILSPLFAAVLMPVSSISVVAFSTFVTNYFAKKSGFTI